VAAVQTTGRWSSLVAIVEDGGEWGGRVRMSEDPSGGGWMGCLVEMLAKSFGDRKKIRINGLPRSLPTIVSTEKKSVQGRSADFFSLGLRVS
jgi:hypothetical protein